MIHAEGYFDARRGAKDVAILSGNDVIPGTLAVQQVRR